MKTSSNEAVNLNRVVSFLFAKSPDDMLDYSGIDTKSVLTEDAIIAQQDLISGAIGLPTTIIQFGANRDGNADPDVDIERIDSKVSSITLRTSCDILRRCTNNDGKYCRDCDAEHAKLLLGLDSNRLRDAMLKRIDDRKRKWQKKYEGQRHDPKPIEDKQRICLLYYCPLFGYREVMFPILFEKRVIAVLIVGQIRIDDEKEESIICGNKVNFFRKNPNIFREYLGHPDIQKRARKNGGDIFTREKIIDYVLKQSKREKIPDYPSVFKSKPGLTIPEVKDKLTEREYQQKIDIVCEKLTKLERIMENEMKRKREIAVRMILEEVLAKFNIKENQEDGFPQDSPGTLQAHIQNLINELVARSGIRSIAVFSGNGSERNPEKLKLVATTPSLNGNDLSHHIFSLTHPNIQSISNPVNSKNNQDLLLAFEPELPKTMKLITIMFQPMPTIRAASVTMLIEYENPAIKESIEDIIIMGLTNLLALLSTRQTIRFEYAAQNQLAKTLRLYKHEIINLANSVKHTVGFLGREDLKKIDNDKIRNVHRDATDTLSMFVFLTENIGLLIDQPIAAKKENVLIYNKLIYKWENSMRIEAFEKNCDFMFLKQQRFYVNTDPRYMELVVYNLFINAVKYAHSHTKIYLHCERDVEPHKYVLSVTNFSRPIPENEVTQIFDMGFRSHYAKDYYYEGSGIGLWIVKKAAELLGGRAVLCEQEKISEYNIPLLHAFITESNAYRIPGGNAEFNEADKEYERLKKQMHKNAFGEETNAISMVVSEFNWKKPNMKEIMWGLREPTAIIRFEVIF